MPLYEYECEKCGRRLEKIQKFSDPHLKTCPACKGKLRKLFSSPAIHFKGSGWYITDYARKSTKDKSSSDPEGKDKSSSDPEGKDKSSSDREGKEKKSGEEKEKPAKEKKASEPPAKPSKDKSSA